MARQRHRHFSNQNGGTNCLRRWANWLGQVGYVRRGQDDWEAALWMVPANSPSAVRGTSQPQRRPLDRARLQQTRVFQPNQQT